MDAASLAQVLGRCLSPDPLIVKAAEQLITTAAQQPDYLQCLSQVIASSDVPLGIRQLATICLKNHVKRYWAEPDRIHALDKTFLKTKIVEFILAASGTPPIQCQLLSALEQVSSIDFPVEWPSLLSEIVNKYLVNPESPLTFEQKHSVLSAIDIVLRRYREAEKSPDVLGELKYHVLPYIEEPIRCLFEESLSSIESGNAVVSKAGVSRDQQEGLVYLKQSFHHCMNLLYCVVKILHSLISVDLPEYIEDHLPFFVNGFLSILKYSNDLVSGKQINDALSGSLEEMKAEVCQVLTHFSLHYTEEFEEFLTPCVVTVLELLESGCTLETLGDAVVTSGMRFLGAASRFKWESDPFTPKRIASICSKVIVPSIKLRDEHIELLEENPIEFIRRALEGEELETRRGTSIELVQSLCQLHEAEICLTLPAYIQSLLEKSATAFSFEENQRMKDAAIYLVIAIVAKSQSRLYGVAKVTSSIDINQFFVSHLSNEFQVPLSGKVSNVLVRSAGLKFIATFRNQLEKDVLLRLLPDIVNNLKVPDPLIQAHTAYCLECLLLARQLPTENTSPTLQPVGPLKFTRGELKPALLNALETLLKSASTQQPGGGLQEEDEYGMRCIVKILSYLQEEACDHILQCLEALRDVLKVQCVVSHNPIFAHYVFEAIGSASRIASAKGLQSNVESILMSTLTPIVAMGDHDFNPYALQILGLLLDTASEANPIYLELLNYLLEEQQWTSSTARVPALVRVLAAFLRKQQLFDSPLESQTNVILSRFQYCLYHKRLTDSAFQLIQDVLHYLPIGRFSTHLQNIVFSMLKRLQAGQTTKLKHEMVMTLSIVNCRSPMPPSLPTILESIQPGLLNNFVTNIYVPTAKALTAVYDKKITLLGLARMCTAVEVQQCQPALTLIIGACATLMGVVTEQDVQRPRLSHCQSIDDVGSLKPGQFEGSFNVLVSAKVPIASRALAEVSPGVLLSNICECFDNKALAELLVADPNWRQIVEFLSMSS